MNIDDEAALLSPYHGGRPFKAAGALRGLHFLQLPEDGEVYSARLDVAGVLPTLLCRRDVPGADPPAALFGPLAFERGDYEHKSIVVYTDGHGFERDLLTGEPVERALDAVGARLERVEVRPHGDESRIHVDVKTGGDGKVRRAAIQLALAVLAAADNIAHRDRRYQNAWEVSELEPPADPSAARVQALKARLEGAAAWAHAHADRSGHALEARVTLTDAGPELHGTMHLRWRDEAGTVVEVDLTGALPEQSGEHADLTPEKTGLSGFLNRLGEMEVGDEPLDKAYVIDAEPGARPLLLRARAPLTELGAYDSRITFEDTRVQSAVRGVPTDGRALEEVVDATLRVWRAAALFRAGYDLDRHDPFAR